MGLHEVQLAAFPVWADPLPNLRYAHECRSRGQCFKLPLRRDQVAPKVQGGVFQRKGENIKGTRPQCCAETIDSQCGAVGEGSPIL